VLYLPEAFLIDTGWMTPKNSEIDRPDNLGATGGAGPSIERSGASGHASA
jgi:hypothetical protein